MYERILVPVDGSVLSMRLVSDAVTLARKLGSKITFLHVRTDFGASSEGALMRSLSPNGFADESAARAKAILAKVESAACAEKVEYELKDVISSNTVSAILSSAKSCNSDLILIASHGRRGIKGVIRGSITQKIVQNSEIAVLVTTVESNVELSDQQRVLQIIGDEHRSLAAVVRGLQFHATEIGHNGAKPNISLLRAMVYYIDHFPEKLHHPKEDEFLFKCIELRTHTIDTEISKLRSQHKESAIALQRLRRAIDSLEEGADDAKAVFCSFAEQFVASQWDHMQAEESMVLPKAAEVLLEQDWQEIATAFSSNGDPLFSSSQTESFEELFQQIVNTQAIHQEKLAV